MVDKVDPCNIRCTDHAGFVAYLEGEYRKPWNDAISYGFRLSFPCNRTAISSLLFNWNRQLQLSESFVMLFSSNEDNIYLTNINNFCPLSDEAWKLKKINSIYRNNKSGLCFIPSTAFINNDFREDNYLRKVLNAIQIITYRKNEIAINNKTEKSHWVQWFSSNMKICCPWNANARPFCHVLQEITWQHINIGVVNTCSNQFKR